jgi:pimeloyl-ACP methyl ester carboxylesterase
MEMTQEEDVRRVCKRLQSLDSDHWCQVWTDMAQSYEERGREQEELGNCENARRNYMLAFTYYRIAWFPLPNTSATKTAYRLSVDNYLKAASFYDSPFEKIVIPFAGNEGEGKEIPVYLRKPKDVERPPILINQPGIGVAKEFLSNVEPSFLERGIATLAMDMPGTGESPVTGATNAERLYDAIITYIQTRDDLDGSRVGLMGMSLGGYWAAKAAHTEFKRVAGVVFWGGGVHYYFQPDWQLKSRDAQSWLGNIDVVTTRYNAFGISSLDEWLEQAPNFSLLTQGILDQPCAPMLLINGKYDLQCPVEDIYLMLEHGLPKTARIFPGGHMGMTPQTLPTVVEWMVQRLQGITN